MKQPFLILALLLSGITDLFAQCRLLDRTTWINPTPFFAEEFNYPASYYNTSANNWSKDPGFSQRWRPLSDDYVADDGATHYYSPSALEMTGSTLKIHADSLPQPIQWTGERARTIRYKSAHLIAGAAADGDDAHGFTYGYYEIRCKLPPTTGPRHGDGHGLWPNFWIVGDTEVDIIDQIDGTGPASELSQGVIDWTNNQNSAGSKAPKNGPDLAADFNVYAALWTPQEVTFFLNDRVVYSVPSSVVKTYPKFARMFLELRTNNLALQNKVGKALLIPAVFEIDYIRAYKLKSNGTPLANYLTSSGYMHHNVITNDANKQNQQEYVSSAANSITVNPSNENQIFYIGTDNLIYRAEHPSSAAPNQWNAQAIDGSNQGQNTAWQAASDLYYNSTLQALVYRGSDNQVHLYKQAWLGGPWQHSYVIPSGGSASAIYPASTCLSVSTNGDIFLITTNNTVVWYKYDSNSATWSQFTMPYTYVAGSTTAKGNLMTEYSNGSTTVYYAGMNDRIQNFWWNRTYYAHSDVSPSGSPLVQPNPGAISQIQNGNIFYVDQSARINHVYYSNGWQWEPQTTPTGTLTSVGGPFNMTWDPQMQQMVYVDRFGGVQGFKQNSSTGVWSSSSINDYYPNTDRYQTYLYASSVLGVASVAVTRTGTVFYKGHDNELQFLLVEGCNVPTSTAANRDNTAALSRYSGPAPTISTPIKEAGVKVYPNPATSLLHLDMTSLGVVSGTYKIYSDQGSLRITGDLRANEFDISIAELPAGIYFLSIQGPDFTHRAKFAKE